MDGIGRWEEVTGMGWGEAGRVGAWSGVKGARRCASAWIRRRVGRDEGRGKVRGGLKI